PSSTQIYTLSLHDALPIFIFQNRDARFLRRTIDEDFALGVFGLVAVAAAPIREKRMRTVRPLMTLVATFAAVALAPAPAMLADRSEEHTSELQSRGHLVCR